MYSVGFPMEPLYKTDNSWFAYSTFNGALALDWTVTGPTTASDLPGTIVVQGTGTNRLARNGAGTTILSGVFIYYPDDIDISKWTVTVYGYAIDYVVVPSYWGVRAGYDIWIFEIFHNSPIWPPSSCRVPPIQ